MRSLRERPAAGRNLPQPELAPRRPDPELSEFFLSVEDLPRRSAEFVTPMECTPVAELPDDPAQWLYELKLDGWRCIAVKQGRSAALYSRYGNNLSSKFPAIRSTLAGLHLPTCVLDGELVALDPEGRPVFQELQNHRTTRLPIFYYVFDVLTFNDRMLRHLALDVRKSVLASLAVNFTDPIRYAATFDVPLPKLVREIRKRHLEGLVAKRRTSIYHPGTRIDSTRSRSSRWVATSPAPRSRAFAS